jgi:hypothetical protein
LPFAPSHPHRTFHPYIFYKFGYIAAGAGIACRILSGLDLMVVIEGILLTVILKFPGMTDYCQHITIRKYDYHQGVIILYSHDLMWEYDTYQHEAVLECCNIFSWNW